MVCDRTQNKVCAVAMRLGVSRLASKGVALAVIGAVGLAVAARRQGQSLETRSATGSLSDLNETPTIFPGPNGGERCAGCQANPTKPGPWYHLSGKAYCADCAPDAAKGAGVRLRGDEPAPRVSSPLAADMFRNKFAAEPTPSRTDGRPITFTRHVVIEPAAVDFPVADGKGRVMRLKLDNIQVLNDKTGRSLGLAITPVIAPDPHSGALRLKPDAWQLTRLSNGQPASRDIFPTSAAAHPYALLLGQFDWHDDRTVAAQAETLTASLTRYKLARGLERPGENEVSVPVTATDTARETRVDTAREGITITAATKTAAHPASSSSPPHRDTWRPGETVTHVDRRAGVNKRVTVVKQLGKLVRLQDDTGQVYMMPARLVKGVAG